MLLSSIPSWGSGWMKNSMENARRCYAHHTGIARHKRPHRMAWWILSSGRALSACSCAHARHIIIRQLQHAEGRRPPPGLAPTPYLTPHPKPPATRPPARIRPAASSEWRRRERRGQRAAGGEVLMIAQLLRKEVVLNFFRKCSLNSHSFYHDNPSE